MPRRINLISVAGKCVREKKHSYLLPSVLLCTRYNGENNYTIAHDPQFIRSQVVFARELAYPTLRFPRSQTVFSLRLGRKLPRSICIMQHLRTTDRSGHLKYPVCIYAQTVRSIGSKPKDLSGFLSPHEIFFQKPIAFFPET